MRIHLSILLLISIVLLCGCTLQPLSAEDRPQVPSQEVLDATPGNRLVILGTDNNIYTMKPDGSERVAITDDGSSVIQYSQPTWSPDGLRLAYTRFVDGSSRGTAVITADYNGQNQESINVSYPPFYYYWSPTGQQLAYLSSWVRGGQPSMAMRLVDYAGERAEVETIGEGQPFYFSWSPDGRQMITHESDETVSIRTLEGGGEESLSTSSSGFPAPQWTADGERLIYVVNGARGQELIVTDVAGDLLNEITVYDGTITFTKSPTSNMLAYVVSDESAPSAALGPLYLVDVETNRTRELSSAPVVAFFWSPDGTKLAYQIVERVSGSFQLQWVVWDVESSSATEYAAYLPTVRYFRRYLTFFDQYAQSMRIWSPESDAFVYAGTNRSGRTGIWVQRLANERPERVAPGSFAAWSPK